MPSPYEILDRKRRGERLEEDELRAVAAGAADGEWDDAQLGAFLMAAAIHGLDGAETRALTLGMVDSGERWELAADAGLVGDKHSTGGVGDKVSLILAPLLAACGLPVAMLTGRGLGHTGGTADKLEGIPGLEVGLSRRDMLKLLASHGMAIGMSTERIAPADRKLYALRDVTGTVASLPLITASILSKKLAMGAAGVVYDVKTGSGAFLSDPGEARALATRLVGISAELDAPATALVTDMSQPLGRWVGHHAEVLECLDCLAGNGPDDLRRITVELGAALADLLGAATTRRGLEETLASGSARETFLSWAEAQGASSSWTASPRLELAPVERPLTARASGRLVLVDTRSLGLLLAAAGGGRRRPGDAVDHGVALRYDRRLGDELTAGDEIGRVYLRRDDESMVARLEAAFVVEDRDCQPPSLIQERIGAPAG